MEPLHSFIDRARNTIKIPQELKAANDAVFSLTDVGAGLLRTSGTAQDRDYPDALILRFKLEGFEEPVEITLNLQSVQQLKRMVQEQELRPDVVP